MHYFFVADDHEKLNDKLYQHEIHLTVNCHPDRLDDFKLLCEKIGVKCTVIDLMLDSFEQHVMTSSVVFCKTEEINNHLNILHSQILPLFDIIRTKVEVPPTCISDQNLDFSYFELHIPCNEDKIHLADKLINDGYVKSQNVNKKGIIDITKRHIDELKILDIEFDLDYLFSKDIVVEGFRPMYEYAIIDTNVNLDKNWIK